MAKRGGEVNAGKTLYNKAQIEYLKGRVDVAVSNVMGRWDEKHPEPDEATDYEKYDQIANGIAKLKSFSQLASGRSQVLYTDLDDAFEFVDPRKEERDAWQNERDALEEQMDKMKRNAEELIFLGNQTALLDYIRSMEDMMPGKLGDD